LLLGGAYEFVCFWRRLRANVRLSRYDVTCLFGIACCFVLVSSLSGSHGEWTSLDDVRFEEMAFAMIFICMFVLFILFVSHLFVYVYAFFVFRFAHVFDFVIGIFRRHRHHRQAPPLVRRGFGNLPWVLLLISSFTVVSSLSGSHGEWTNGDDFDHQGQAEGVHRQLREMVPEHRNNGIDAALAQFAIPVGRQVHQRNHPPGGRGVRPAQAQALLVDPAIAFADDQRREQARLDAERREADRVRTRDEKVAMWLSTHLGTVYVNQRQPYSQFWQGVRSWSWHLLVLCFASFVLSTPGFVAASLWFSYKIWASWLPDAQQRTFGRPIYGYDTTSRLGKTYHYLGYRANYSTPIYTYIHTRMHAKVAGTISAPSNLPGTLLGWANREFSKCDDLDVTLDQEVLWHTAVSVYQIMLAQKDRLRYIHGGNTTTMEVANASFS